MSDDRRDDYLWDKSGPPDPEVARLEQLLGGEAYDRPAPAPVLRRRRTRSFRYVAVGLAAAAAAAVVAFALRPGGAPRVAIAPPQPDAALGHGWNVEALAGAPRCGDAPCRELRPGEWLETLAGERAEVAVADIGHIQVEGGSRVRLVATGPEQHHLELAVGTLHAQVVAPPRLLVVDTPTATAVDLGCAYELSVDADGATRLEVTSGWVALEGEGFTAYVPAGATARSRAGATPSTPLFLDAPPELVAAVARLDVEPGDLPALRDALASARQRDTLTLWHVMQRVPAGRPRYAVLARMTELAPRPVGVSEASLLALEPEAMETYRNALWAHW